MTIETIVAVLAKGTRFLTAACVALSVFLFAASLAIMTAEIVLRYVFNHPLQHIGEAVIIAFIYVYLVGGACAVLHDWRSSTIDIDIDLDPGLDALLREIPAIKEDLQVNVELASPAHFIPELPGWRDRSPFVIREGTIDFHHYDFYAQALSKIERAHDRDVDDVREMAARGLIEPAATRRRRRF